MKSVTPESEKWNRSIKKWAALCQSIQSCAALTGKDRSVESSDQERRNQYS